MQRLLDDAYLQRKHLRIIEMQKLLCNAYLPYLMGFFDVQREHFNA